jgi:hypothetical protein
MKSSARRAADQAAPMHPVSLPAPALRISPLERTCREGLGYEESYSGKRGNPVMNRALAELARINQACYRVEP